MIKLIDINKLYPHPQNPRLDLGDITELADSIKAVGILQNLTVVKGHKITHDEWSDLSRQYDETPTEELRNKMNSRKSEDGYTVIIGHRRLGSSKACRYYRIALCNCRYGRKNTGRNNAA